MAVILSPAQLRLLLIWRAKTVEPMNDPPKVGFVELRMFQVTAAS
ncbi:hypothetical protein FOMG_16425 [Fusarium oxysporum f. sp. melonis 26406]|uniref:Uncharacterized protein n=2 Tax=Fusarium oxysporum TaxID=5507 RepID=W9ZEK4_FUSOX|nr:hypothetical protein FOVG_17865 [Fusarium oxysporum f. sp. pisi HDV247]EXK26987.1 hypothetical protein FOMG_16425 [Fusarium oxysporum f. sp. melonis 26406]